VFFDQDGEILYRHVGALESDGFIELAQQVIAFPEVQSSYLENPENLGNLIRYLEIFKVIDPNQAELLAHDALNGMDERDWRTEEAWFLISNFTPQIKSETTIYVVENASFYYNRYENFNDFLGNLYGITIERAALEDDLDLAELAATYEIKVRREIDLLEYNEGYYRLDALGQFYLEMGDLNNYFDYMDSLSVSYRYDDWNYLSELVVEHAEAFFDDKMKMTRILAWSQRALDLQDNYYTNFARSYTYYMAGSNSEALSFAKKAYDTCEEEEVKGELNGYISEIESKIREKQK